ncbi:metallophosphoesterase family protein [Candidatus Bipolaricaulota bacterium]|nr:metallophosphoesterase family protein [Candidatus Bipolaricaulota bacterium]
MKRVLVGWMVGIAVGLVGICGVAQVSQVHLGWSENDVYTTITVMWHSPMGGNQRVLYDEVSHPSSTGYPYQEIGVAHTIQPTHAPDGQSITTAAFDGIYYRAALTGLEPGTTYFFRVKGTGPGGTTQEWSFRTIAPNQVVSFAFAGDSQRPFETPEGEMGQLLSMPKSPANWPYMRDFLTDLMADQGPDFVLALGDVVCRGNLQAQWDHWFDAWQEHAVTDSGRMIPIVPVIGNHDTSGYPNIDASYEWFLGQFAIPQPVPGVPCYALDFPNLHVTVLSATSGQVASNWNAAQAEAQAQASWLTQDLQASGAPWKIVAFHYNYMGCYLSCTGYPSDCYMTAWTPAFESNNVDMVFMGHVHNYTRTWPVTLAYDGACLGANCGVELMPSSEDGITYIVSGTWGGPTNAIVEGTACEIRPWIAAAAGHPSVGFARVYPNTLGIAMTDTTGALLDTCTLPYTVSSFPTPDYVPMIP